MIVSTKPGWHKIGELKADFKTESESLVILGNDKFKAIKFKVTDAPITLEKLVVYYEDDLTQNIPMKGLIKPGKESGEFYLQDVSREIKKVMFTYHSEPNFKDKKASVELYGYK